jgi:hypothetical protein
VPKHQPEKKAEPKPEIPEGVRQEVLLRGWAINPHTGKVINRDDLK